ncbi:IucA/IucC family protein [Halalkalibacter okhensis]|uniref:Siderophore biosynthesis protein n=1 Tax=Halalkalibacter okhensis TaxID=333138 RepID=A0A0B0IBZ1_9BACI|nr:IucA/IucC family protein [Halalkalibacter okhensis]KHF40108.1 siderophore biosynthesis protein [Halalkalibacter okhensis]
MQKLCPLPSDKQMARATRQLLEAMMFEGFISFEEMKNEGDRYSLFCLYGKQRTYRCQGRKMAFDRIRIKENSLFEVRDQSLIETTIEELLEELFSNDDEKAHLHHELWQTVKLCQWNEAQLLQPLSRRYSSYEELESEIIEGHPYHPCYKSRTNFTLEDHEKFGPEAKQSFSLIWVAVRRNKALVSMLEEEKEFWQRELGLDMWVECIQQLEQIGESVEDYTFLPVHPWQWNSLQEHLTKYTEKNDIYLLGVKGDSYRATQSVRSLLNRTHPNKAYMKLSMNMVNTSSLRTLQSHSVCSAPYISAWLERIIQSDSYLKEEAQLVILKEYAGVSFVPEEKALAGQLGAIWRESVHTYLKEEEQAVPFTALMLIEKDKRAFIHPWLAFYGIEEWIRQFIEVSVVPIWHLLVAHGIAVEAHAQNMILLHEDGWPTRVVLRDFHESIEYTNDFIADKSLVPHFEKLHKDYEGAPDDVYYWMSNVEALRELVMDTLFVFHLTELSSLLEEQVGYSEEAFWIQVEAAISRHLRRFPELTTRHEQLDYKKPNIYVESLLQKKIHGIEEENYRHLVRNVFNREEG